MSIRILHAALLSKYEPGICRQMADEAMAARAEGIAWESVAYVPCVRGSLEALPLPLRCLITLDLPYSSGGLLRRIWVWFLVRCAFYRALARHLMDFDLVLLRYSVADPLQFLFLLLYGRRVLTVHHTLELDELRTLSDRLRKVRLGLERVLGGVSRRLVFGVVSVTLEIAEHQLSRSGGRAIRSFVYPNGVLLDEGPIPARDEGGAKIEVIFVASEFRPWQGLDELLESMRMYSGAVTLHLVGELDSQQKVRASLDQRVRVHGLKSRDEISVLIRQCDVGLTGLALERKGMRQACSLKVREYFSSGLPVYSGHIDVFPDEFKYYRKGPASIAEIIEYARRLRNETPESIRRAARPYIDKRLLLRGLHVSLSKSIECAE